MWTGRTPAHRLASSSAVVTPANPPPRIRMRGASDVDGRASTRPVTGPGSFWGCGILAALGSVLGLVSLWILRVRGGSWGQAWTGPEAAQETAFRRPRPG